MGTKVVVQHIAGMKKTKCETVGNILLKMIEKERTCTNKMCSSITLLQIWPSEYKKARPYKSTLTSQRYRFLLHFSFTFSPHSLSSFKIKTHLLLQLPNNASHDQINRFQFIRARFTVQQVLRETNRKQKVMWCIRVTNRRTHHRLLILIRRMLHVDLSLIRIRRPQLQSSGSTVDSINRMGPTGHVALAPLSSPCVTGPFLSNLLHPYVINMSLGITNIHRKRT